MALVASTSQINAFLGANQYKMDLPQQYYGDEPNTYQKDFEESSVRWLLFTCWPYEAAAGNQAIPIVYKMVNEAGEKYMADRFYLPATPRDLSMLEKNGIPLFGIESKRPAKDFDVLGTSISYSVLSISLAKMLTVAGLPIRWKDREERAEDYPFVLVGGQAYGNPEFVAPMIDAFWCGEVEDEEGHPGIAAVCERIDDLKRAGLWSTDRIECYRWLAREFPFLYFPRFMDVIYGYEDRSDVGLELPSKQVMGYRSNVPEMKVPILKRHVKDLDAVPALTNPPLLYVDPGMGAGDLEVGRGCPAWCSFCALTYRQKPYRQRSVEYMREFATEFKKNVGSVHLAPFSPDFPMHTQRKRLVADLLENVSDEVDSSSMRVDDFIADGDYISLQVYGGMDQVTLGVEGNSQRMRDLVGKGCADEDIKEAVAKGIRAGVRKFKLYMISNLPGEDEHDVFRILRLAKELADIRDQMGQSNVRIQFSWTPLLIDPNTPFQWFAPPASSRLLGEVWEEFRDIKIDFKMGGKAEPNKISYYQLAQRCSRDGGEALVDVLEKMVKKPGQAFFGGVPKKIPAYEDQRSTEQAINIAMKERGFLNGVDDAWDERFKIDLFGWEFIDQGINSELLWITYQQMREFVEQTDSSTYDKHFKDDYHGNEWIERCDTKCYGKTCGTCDVADLQIRRSYIQGARQERDIDLAKVKVVDEKSVALQVRLRVHKHNDKRFVGNDHWRFALRRAAYRASDRLNTEFQITKRSIVFASDKVKFKDFTSGVDYVQFGITRPVSRDVLQEWLQAINEELTGMHLETEEWILLPRQGSSLRQDLDLSLWELELDVESSRVQSAIRKFNLSNYVKMVVKADGGFGGNDREEVNAKDYCDGVWLVRDGISTKLRFLLRGKPSPYEFYAALMERSSWIEAAKYPVERIEAFVGIDEDQSDFFRPTCLETGKAIPINPMNQPYSPEYTPQILDAKEGRLVKSS